MIPVVYIAEQKDVKYVIMSASSVLRYNSDVQFIIISPNQLEMSQFSLLVGRNYTNYVCYISEEGESHPEISDKAFIKLRIPEILKNYSKCLYLDCKTICRKEVDAIKAAYIALNENPSCVGMPSTDVMFMNLSALRACNMKKECLEYIKKNNFVSEEEIITQTMFDKIKFVRNLSCEYRGNSTISADTDFVHFSENLKYEMTRMKHEQDRRDISYNAC